MFRLSLLLIAPFVVVLRVLATVARALFGTLTWKPPRWLRRIMFPISTWGRSHPRAAVSAALCLLLLAAVSMWGWRWYERQPKPHKVYAEVAAIPVTPLDKELKFPPLVVDFSEPAARLEDLNKPAPGNVRLDPPHPAAWKWVSDRKACL